MSHKIFTNLLKTNRAELQNFIKIIPFVLFLIVAFPKLFYAQVDYYWYKNQKIYLEKKPDKKFVIVDNNVTNSIELKQTINTSDISVSELKSFNIKGVIYYDEDIINEKNWTIMESSDFNNINISENEHILYQTPFYHLNGKEIGLSHLFYAFMVYFGMYTIFNG